MPYKFLTFIPYVNRKDLLFAAIQSIELFWPTLVVIDNSESGELRSEKLPGSLLSPPVPLDFSQTQNLMQKIAIEGNADFFLFMHADAQAIGDTPQKLLESIATAPSDWGTMFTNGDALCVFKTEAVKKVGQWDWRGLNWYFSDKDYYRRVKLAGYLDIETQLPVKHVPSQTRAADRHIEMIVDSQLTAANTYYILKWGGPPGKEIFSTPFNA